MHSLPQDRDHLIGNAIGVNNQTATDLYTDACAYLHRWIKKWQDQTIDVFRRHVVDVIRAEPSFGKMNEQDRPDAWEARFSVDVPPGRMWTWSAKTVQKHINIQRSLQWGRIIEYVESRYVLHASSFFKKNFAWIDIPAEQRYAIQDDFNQQYPSLVNNCDWFVQKHATVLIQTQLNFDKKRKPEQPSWKEKVHDIQNAKHLKKSADLYARNSENIEGYDQQRRPPKEMGERQQQIREVLGPLMYAPCRMKIAIAIANAMIYHSTAQLSALTNSKF